MTHRSWLKFLSSSSVNNARREKSGDSREDNKYPPTLRPKSIFNRHFDIIESNISGASGRGVTGLDRLGLDAFNSWDQNDSETIFGLATCGEAGGGVSECRIEPRVECTH
jgi:hypothetical protein